MVSETQPRSHSASFVMLTPIWQPSLGDTELRSLSISAGANKAVDKIFIAPEHLPLDFYRDRFPTWQFHLFDSRNFESVRAYSYWMTQPEIYRTFAHYDYMVMCQLDSILLRDVRDLPVVDWDYLGATWEPAVRILKLGQRALVATLAPRSEGPWWVKLMGRKVAVGNGGLSVRRVSAMIKCSEALLNKYRDSLRTGLLEDLYFSALGPSVGLRVAEESLAGSVFAEAAAAGLSDPGEFFGFHGLEHTNPELLDRIIRR